MTRVSFYHDPDFGEYYFGPAHAMKPFRYNLTYELIMNYGIYDRMSIYHPRLLSAIEMTKFHTEDYVSFLQSVSPSDASSLVDNATGNNSFNVSDECPPFVGVFPYCQRSCGGSVSGASHLIANEADIAINWMGGMHHAKRDEASGFCFANDIVLGTLELLKFFPRVLYVDIDIHHGDGVEEAFYTTDRVMTVSFHKYGDAFFPGTGHLDDVGADNGEGYAVNVPLRDGMDDECYVTIFKAVIGHVMQFFRPGAVVLQCGADSLANDRLGCFNLTLAGHGECVSYVKSFGLPTLVLGGGGYTMRNVARCWAYETAICVDAALPDAIPHNAYYEYFSPDYSLNIVKNNQDNLNTKEELTRKVQAIVDRLRTLQPAPGVQMKQMPDLLHEDPGQDLDHAADTRPDERVPDVTADMTRWSDSDERRSMRPHDFTE